MMEQVRQYLLSVVSASIISGLAINIFGKNSSHRKLIKIITGLFITVTVVAPAVSIRINDLTLHLNSVEQQADAIVSDGESIVTEQKREIIQKQSEAYIQDKADALNLDITIHVEVTDQSPPTPYKVIIPGAASPYSKQQLQEIITRDLAIPEENLKWT